MAAVPCIPVLRGLDPPDPPAESFPASLGPGRPEARKPETQAAKESGSEGVRQPGLEWREGSAKDLDPPDPSAGVFPATLGPDLGATSWDPEGPVGPFLAAQEPRRRGAREPQSYQAASEPGNQGARQPGTTREPGSQAASNLGIQGAKHR